MAQDGFFGVQSGAALVTGLTRSYERHLARQADLFRFKIAMDQQKLQNRVQQFQVTEQARTQNTASRVKIAQLENQTFRNPAVIGSIGALKRGIATSEESLRTTFGGDGAPVRQIRTPSATTVPISRIGTAKPGAVAGEPDTTQDPPSPIRGIGPRQRPTVETKDGVQVIRTERGLFKTKTTAEFGTQPDFNSPIAEKAPVEAGEGDKGIITVENKTRDAIRDLEIDIPGLGEVKSFEEFANKLNINAIPEDSDVAEAAFTKIARNIESQIGKQIDDNFVQNDAALHPIAQDIIVDKFHDAIAGLDVSEGEKAKLDAQVDKLGPGDPVEIATRAVRTKLRPKLGNAITKLIDKSPALAGALGAIAPIPTAIAARDVLGGGAVVAAGVVADPIIEAFGGTKDKLKRLGRDIARPDVTRAELQKAVPEIKKEVIATLHRTGQVTKLATEALQEMTDDQKRALLGDDLAPDTAADIDELAFWKMQDLVSNEVTLVTGDTVDRAIAKAILDAGVKVSGKAVRGTIKAGQKSEDIIEQGKKKGIRVGIGLGIDGFLRSIGARKVKEEDNGEE